jgi:hypothetical protein
LAGNRRIFRFYLKTLAKLLGAAKLIRQYEKRLGAVYRTADLGRKIKTEGVALMGKTLRLKLGLAAGLLAAGMGLAEEETVSTREFEALQAEVLELKTLLNANQVQTEEGLQNAEAKSKTPIPEIPEGLEFGALVEVEAGYSSTDSDDESDITLATVELSAGWQLSDWVRGDLIFLYEEDDTEPMDVDQAYITLGNTERLPLYVQFGKMYVPFGKLDSLFVSDPIVLELAETLETAALLGVEAGGFNASVSVFNGDVETEGEDHVENVVLAVSYAIEGEKASVAFGGSWIRNILDSDGLTGVLDDEFGYAYTADDTAGVNAWMTATMGRATLIAEYVKVLDDIEVDGASTGLAPESLNFEVGFALTDSIEIGAKYEISDEVADWYAEKRYGLVCGYAFPEMPYGAMGLSLEYMREDFDGDEEGDLVTAQLAVEF